jgi:hypothetical protein
MNVGTEKPLYAPRRGTLHVTEICSAVTGTYRNGCSVVCTVMHGYAWTPLEGMTWKRDEGMICIFKGLISHGKLDLYGQYITFPLTHSNNE